MARLRSQNGLGRKWLLLCQEGHAWTPDHSGDRHPGLGAAHLAVCGLMEGKQPQEHQPLTGSPHPALHLPTAQATLSGLQIPAAFVLSLKKRKKAVPGSLSPENSPTLSPYS